MSNWVYIRSEKRPPLYTVGFYRPDGGWEPDSDHTELEEVAKRVHWLNGGWLNGAKILEDAK